MELYTLNPSTFIPMKLVDGFISAIWTERYFKCGDVQLIVPATSEMYELLPEKTLLALRGSKEVMLLDTQNIKDGLMTISGKTLDFFLNERMAWFKNTDESEGASSTAEYVETTSAGQFMANVVNATVISPVDQWTGTGPDLDWEKDAIPFLELDSGEIDTNGVDDRPLRFPIGPLYDGLEQLAISHGLGFRMYLLSAIPAGYVLRFGIYRGRDKTSDQDVNKLVRLSPNLNSLSEVNEIRSIAEYKNVVYVHYKNVISIHYAEPTLPIPEGFDRRVMVRFAEGDSQAPLADTTESVLAYRAQHAVDAFANNNYIRAIDGQAGSISDYVYGKHYYLGDIIELEGITGTLAKARVTEYIRSQDQQGERAYPTISVVDPLDSGNMPTLDPTPDPFVDTEAVGDPYPEPDPEDPDPDPDPTLGPDDIKIISEPETVPDPSPYPDPDPQEPDPDPDPPGTLGPGWFYNALDPPASKTRVAGFPSLMSVFNVYLPNASGSGFPNEAYDVRYYLAMDFNIPLKIPATDPSEFDDIEGLAMEVNCHDFIGLIDVQDSRATRSFRYFGDDTYYPIDEDPPEGVTEVVMKWELVLDYLDKPLFGLVRKVIPGPQPEPGKQIDFYWEPDDTKTWLTLGSVELGLKFRQP